MLPASAAGRALERAVESAAVPSPVSAWALVPSAGLATTRLQEEGQAGLSKSTRLSRGSGPCQGRESLGAAERVLPPPGVFSTCSYTLPAAIVLPLRYEPRAGPGCLPSAVLPAELVRGCSIRRAHKVSPEGP